MRDIGHALRRNPSSVSRELTRNRVKGRYDPQKANHKAYARRKDAKYQGMKVMQNLEIRRYVRENMEEKHWSPEQIAGRITIDTKGRLSLHHTTVYKYLYGSYGQGLCRYLRYKRYRKKRRTQKKSVKEVIKNRVFIDSRPRVVNERGRYGDFEGDTMGRPTYASSETLVVARERKSRKLFARKVSRLKYAVEGFQRIFVSLPVESLTLDNGVENARYEELNIPTYFCHPYSSWEKASVEQGIGLIREYIPKKADLKDYSDRDISAIMHTINDTPMKCLGWRTSNEVFEEQLSLSGCCT